LHTAVTSASGRSVGEDLTVDVSIRRARVLVDTLRDVQDRVRRALDAHALPSERRPSSSRACSASASSPRGPR
jgi:hypothetical protein